MHLSSIFFKTYRTLYASRLEERRVSLKITCSLMRMRSGHFKLQKTEIAASIICTNVTKALYKADNLFFLVEKIIDI